MAQPAAGGVRVVMSMAVFRLNHPRDRTPGQGVFRWYLLIGACRCGKT